jgi:hypothetical protein
MLGDYGLKKNDWYGALVCEVLKWIQLATEINAFCTSSLS